MAHFSPICLFVYNRPNEVTEAINALKKNIYAEDSDLYIFSDAAKDQYAVETVKMVRDIIHIVAGFKSVTIIESEENKGLANSIIEGVTFVINKYGKAIVLEDDLITSPNFLSYMNQALVFYQENSQILSISGCTFKVDIPKDYPYDIYFTHRMSSYGWATWKDRWVTIDWDVKDYRQFKYNLQKNIQFMKGGEDLPRMLSAYMKGRINSWAIRFCYHQYKTETYTVYPIESKVDNVGFSSGASNTKRRKRYDIIEFHESKKDVFHYASEVQVNQIINRGFLRKYRTLNRIIANYILKN